MSACERLWCEGKLDNVGKDSLTARTRSRDVLPAFWRPIIVTSISVALSSQVSSSSRYHPRGSRVRAKWARRGKVRARGPSIAENHPRCSSREAKCTHQNVLNSQSYTFRKSPAMVVVYNERDALVWRR
ncbi:hypothetical protein CCUS01_10033 [Colletotrichum cuscutae]|uniref:Uncharacterized protein n=1 Tax=Colletotrichum cuscutae TaxID=1209917 RepID=A0AAI9UFY9_9PEZI|nr:hypothetical protein CCUS01_10033 [Colletotrichum cuscutae]